tara:strand:- start:28 stop:876 length:849 start_codon:yes stop_codon:yes gene_type:complete
MTEQTEILGGVSPLKARQSSRGGKSAGRATSTSGRRGGFAKSKGVRGGGGRNVGGYNVQTRFSADKWKKPASGGYLPSTSSTTPSPTKPYKTDDKGNIVINNNVYNNAMANASVNTGGGGGKKVTTTPDKYGTRTIPAVTGKRKTFTSYDKAWKDNFTITEDGKRKDEHGNVYTDDEEGFKKFKKATDEYNRRTGHTTLKEEKYEISPERKEKYLIEKGTTTIEDAASDTADISASASATAESSTNTTTDKEKDEETSSLPFKMRGSPFFRNYGIGGKPKKK